RVARDRRISEKRRRNDEGMLWLAYRPRANRAVRARIRASARRDLVLLSGRRRRADHQDRRRPRRGFRKGKSGYQGAADLLRLVSGLDPNKAPATWAEMVSFAQKLTKRDASGKVTQWGVQIPSSGFPYWLFQGLTTENDVILMNPAGTETYYDKQAVIEALQFWLDL